MLKILKEPDAQNVAVGTATVKINTRNNVHKVYLRPVTAAGVELTRAEMIADLSDISVKLDGEEIWGVDTTFLLDRQKYFGDISMGGNVNGCLPLIFTRPLLNTYAERAASALGLKNIGSFTIDVKVIGIVKVSRIEVFSVVDDEPQRDLGQHIKINRYSRAWAGATTEDVNDLPTGDDRMIAYLCQHIHHTVGTLDSVRVRKNGSDVFDSVPALLQGAILNEAGRSPQANYFHIDFDLPNQYLSVLPMPAESFFQQFNWSVAPTTYQLYTERLFKDSKAKK